MEYNSDKFCRNATIINKVIVDLSFSFHANFKLTGITMSINVARMGSAPKHSYIKTTQNLSYLNRTVVSD